MVKEKFDYDGCLRFLSEKEDAKQHRNRELYLQAKRDAARIIEKIKKYGPIRIYQWGSLLCSEAFDENSDIDIAVEGLVSAEIFFKMYGEAESLTTFSLDLVELEKVAEPHKRSIIKNGRLVYEKQ